MAARTDWSVAGALEGWTSTRASPEAAPRAWQHEQMDGSVVLKCTSRGIYLNRLVAPNRFHYELPAPSQRKGGGGGGEGEESPAALTSSLHDRLVNEGRRADKRIEVRLFWAQNAADHYLGEWVVEDVLVTPVSSTLVLVRLASQSEVVLDAYRITPPKRARSHSEARHLEEIRAWLPGWKVAHEPETALGLDAPVVVGGVLQDFAGDAYTHDYVVASPRGCKRLCIESKADDHGLTEEAKQKCRALRDTSLCRVVAMVDHGPALHWHDFGPPGSGKDDERTFKRTEAGALNLALGVVVSAETPARAACDAPMPGPGPSSPPQAQTGLSLCDRDHAPLAA